MTEQRDLFSPDERDTAADGVAMARAALDGSLTPEERLAARDAAVAQVEANHANWVDHVALPFIARYLEQHPTLFVDDLWRAGLARPAEPKALGAAIRKAAFKGWMRRSGEYRISEGNGNDKPVWTSLLFDKETSDV